MVKYMRIFIVLAAVAAGTCALSAQTVTVRTEHTVSADRGRYESRREVRRYSSRDFWKAERWSVRAGMATPSYTTSTFADGISSWTWRPTPDAGLSEIYGEYNGITKSTGAFCFGADYQLARWFSFSLDLSAAFVWHDIYNGISRQKTGSRTGAVLCLLPQAKLVFLNRPSVRIYGKFGLGIVKYLGFDKRNWEYDYDYDYDDPPLCYVDNSLVPGFQWVPVGVEVGKKFFGFAETGIGTLYKGISAGVGYKF